jgi:4-amino-4-deoxy-L-arabinose transferase-like glycosyltransferase
MTRRRIPTNAGMFVAILLLVFMALLSFGAVLRESPTFDEIAHIGAGLSYVQKFDLRLNPEHPPLTKALSGLALTLCGTYADYAGPAWNYSKDFLPAFLGQWSFGQSVISRWNNSETTLIWARLPMLLLTLALGWTIFAFATRLGGVWGGLICLAVYVSAPVFLAFGPLVLTDIPIALFSVLTIWAFANLWRSPQRANVWVFALCLSGAFLSKFSALILLLGILTSGLTTRWLPLYDQPASTNERKVWRRLRWRAAGKGLLWTVLLVYAFYLVLSWKQPTDNLQRIGSSVPALVLRRLLLPPATYLGGMFLVLFTFGRSTFLLGHIYRQGVWFFYPVVFALKSQLGFLGLLLLTALLGLDRKRSRGFVGPTIAPELRMHWRTLWVTLVVFAGVCIVSHFDISVRHFSVPLALLILMLAPVHRMLEGTAGESKGLFHAGAAATAVLALGCLFTAAHAYPWYLPYVNAIGAGNPVYTLMSDSNVDWNGALPEVRQFAERNKLQSLALDSYGMFDDTLFVPQSRPWDCQVPTPGDANQWIVVSANMILDAANCSWLMQYEQQELAGGSMYAVHLPKEIPPYGTAGGPPLPAERRSFLGAPFDMKAVMLQVSRHPETIPEVLRQFQKPSASAHQ